MRIPVWLKRFRYHPRNAAVRYCRECGQEQNLYIGPLGPAVGWWEAMGYIRDPGCRCHLRIPEAFRV